MKNIIIKILSLCIIISTALYVGTACDETIHEHSCVTQVVEPTCTEKGYTIYTCECGETYNDTYVEALGHSFTNYISDNNATYDADGTKTATCDREGCNETDTITDADSKLIPSQGLEFALNDDQESYSVTDIGTCTDTILVIPSNYENKPVTIIGEYAFEGCSSLTNIVLPNSVTSIGEGAFFDCDNLKSVTLSNNIKTIGYASFGECGALEEINIPASVNVIGEVAFGLCSNLINITVDDENANYKDIDGNLYSKDGTTLIQYAIGKTQTTFTIPNCVTTIGFLAFAYSNNLTNVIIGDSVTSIEFFAFCYSNSLASIILGSNINNIDESAFYECHSLVEVVNKSPYITATKGYGVGSYALKVYNSEDTFVESKISIDNDYIIFTDETEKILVGYKGSDTELIIPNYVTKINKYAFYECENITSVIIPDSVTCIDENAFDDCNSLKSVTIGNGVKYIYEKAFAYCESITTLTLGKSVEEIGNMAFYGCENITSIEMPNSVTSIGYSAFSGCTAEIKWGVAPSITEIGSYAFSGYKGTSITIPNSVTSIGLGAFEKCYKLVEVVNKSPHITITKGDWDNGYIGYYALVVYNSNDTFTGTKLANDNGYIVYTEGNEKILVGYLGTQTELTIPNYVTKINDYAFYNCDNLASVTIGNSVTSIGSSAFSNCYSLTSIEIPNSVTSIGDYAFCDCDSLTSVTIGNSVTSIGEGAFAHCYSLTSVTIGNSVTSIGDDAFAHCYSLTSIEIPNSVTSIGELAFADCYSLTNIKVNANNTTYKDIDGNLYSKDGTTLIQYAIGKTQTTFTIPNSVTSIGNFAFRDCDNLTSVTIGNSVTSIGYYAFAYCDSLTIVTFSDTTTWYICDDWWSQTNGTEIDLTNPSNNADYFKSAYSQYYWYKS